MGAPRTIPLKADSKSEGSIFRQPHADTVLSQEESRSRGGSPVPIENPPFGFSRDFVVDMANSSPAGPPLIVSKQVGIGRCNTEANFNSMDRIKSGIHVQQVRRNPRATGWLISHDNRQEIKGKSVPAELAFRPNSKACASINVIAVASVGKRNCSVMNPSASWALLA